MFVSRLFPRPEKALSGVFVLEQAKSLVDCGVEVEVVSPRPRRLLSPSSLRDRGRRADVRAATVDGVPALYVDYDHIPLRLSTRFEAWSLTRRLLPVVGREHERAPIDVLHAHQLFPTGYATTIVGRRLGIPVVCTAHGSDVHTHPYRNRGTARYTRAALRSMHRVVAVSEELAGRIARLESRSAPVEVIYNGIDPGRFRGTVDKTELRRHLGLPLSGTGICTVSRLASAKGIPELVGAFRTVLESEADVWLAIVGDGPLRSELRSWADTLEGRLIPVGPVAHARVPDYLNAADVFALPSHQEGLPVAMLEAMACGLPVVVSAVGGIPEAVTDGSTGFLVRPRDEHQLARAITSLVRDVPLRTGMGSAARDVILENFLWSHGSEKLASLYAALTGSELAIAGTHSQGDESHLDAS